MIGMADKRRKCIVKYTENCNRRVRKRMRKPKTKQNVEKK